jgi:S1-C subfamily serine protease
MLRTLRIPFVSALLGGAVVALVLLVLGAGRGGNTTTVVREAPLAGRAVADRTRANGLTPHDIYVRTAPGVVFIRAEIVQDVQSPFDLFPQRQRSEATGSGFVIDESGRILTNAHVIDGASSVSVKFADNRTEPAKVVGVDHNDDLALLKVDVSHEAVRPLDLGDSDTVQVGDPTLAIGNPFGLDRTLTTGIVSALQRQIQAPNGFSIDHVIQTDAAINPGNSGGPLLDASGRVIGINSQIATGGSGGGSVGIGFAVPINTAKSVLGDLEKHGRVARAYLGITGVGIDDSLAQLNLSTKQGVLVQTVTKGGPADKAGLRGGDAQADVGGQTIGLGGDVIEKVDGKAVRTVDDVVSIVERHKPGETVAIQYVRAGASHTAEVTLGNRPDRTPSR